MDRSNHSASAAKCLRGLVLEVRVVVTDQLMLICAVALLAISAAILLLLPRFPSWSRN